MDLAKTVRDYMRIREAKRALAERHAKEMGKLNEFLRKRESALLSYLNDNHAESVRTNEGTFYKATRTTAKVVEWEPCLTFILEHNMLHMLERRVSKSAVEEYLAATGELPPGVSVSSEVTVNIRSS